MNKRIIWTLLSNQAPKKQGFYHVQVVTPKNEQTPASTIETIADWRELDKNQGKVWWAFESSDPQIEKTPVLLGNVTAFAAVGKEEVARHLARELTIPEKIEKAYQNFLLSNNLYPPFRPVRPECRVLEVGDALVLGALRDCVMVDSREDGQIIVLSYRNWESNYGKPKDLGTDYRACHWVDVVRKHKVVPSNLTADSLMYDSYRNSTLSSLISKMMRGIDGSPDYQRGYAWGHDDKQRYLDSLMQGRELGRFIFVNRPYPQLDEILDGKQRLTCLMEFYCSQISFNGKYFHELSISDQQRIENRSVQFAEIAGSRYKQSQLLEIFLEVNSAGVPQTEEHLEHVRTLLAEARAANL